MPLYAHSFTVTPPARYDGVPWTTLRTQECATAAGTFATIDTRAITPDPTPETAAPVTVTITTATLATGYYRFVFIDAAGVESAPIGPVLDPTEDGSPAQALAKLSLLVLSSEDPVMSAAQLEDVLGSARRPDRDGRLYGDPDWTPTWDFDAAAAEGWRRKAGLAAAAFNFAEDGQRFDRAQVYAHCLEQAEQYGKRGMGSIPVGAPS